MDWTPSQVNSFRVATVTERLGNHVGPNPKDDTFEFFNLCLSLARGIDYAVANNEVPDNSQELPQLLKKVCERKVLLLQAAIMVLMVSVKSACKIGWYSSEVTKELYALADEVASNFISPSDVNTDANDLHQNISPIMARFYPQLKMGLTLAVLEVKPGYGTYLKDFHIPKNIDVSKEDKVKLFVAQTDNMETSSCLINPPQGNFLINGKAVEKRTNVYMEAGPLLPTTIMNMLKYGTNIIQVLGQFTGNYVVVVAYMSVVSDLDKSVLQNYVPPEVAVHDQDSELVEGPSRISLNCPISFQRIKTPVKGHSCKHMQCFDFDNFVNMNSRRPSWRCPHCNQSVSYVDIRVDQYMVKVLNEVEKDVTEVIISADGSWKPVTKGHENSNTPGDAAPSCPQDMSADSSNVPLALLDLTEGDDIMDEAPMEIQDVKPILADIPNHFSIENATASAVTSNQNITSQDGTGQSAPDFWSQMLMSTYSTEGSDPRSQPQMFNSVSGSVLSNLQLLQAQLGNSMVSNEYGTDPLVTRPRVPGAAIQALPVQSPTSVPQYTLLRNNSANATTPMGDALGTNYNTAERQMQSARSAMNYLQASLTNQSHLNPPHMSPMNASSFPQFQTQNWHHQSQLPQLPTQPSAPLPTASPMVFSAQHQNTRQHPVRPSNHRTPHRMVQSPNPGQYSSQSRNHISSAQQQTPNPLRPTSQSPHNMVQPPNPGHYSSQSRNHIPSAQQQTPNPLRPSSQSPHNMVQSSTLGRSSSQSPRNHIPSSAQQQNPFSQRPTMGGMRRLPNTTPISNQPTRVMPSVPISQGVNIMDTSSPSIRPTNNSQNEEASWRPSGRMRGALQGQDYSAAFEKFIFQPAQPVQATRPPTLPVPLVVASTTNTPGVPSPSHADTSVSGSSPPVPGSVSAPK